ncbi:MAG: hypothetical protein Q8P69_01835 [bacterium]|nr:hypothetical protein [bacterium]
MTIQTTTRKTFSSDDVNSLFTPPPRRPTTLETFEISRARLADAKLAPIDMFDRFAKRLPPDGTPFLLVPPQPGRLANMDWNEHMARVQLNGQTGRNYLTVSELTDLDSVVSVPRMLVNVEDGRQRLNIEPTATQTDITSAGRFGYGLWTGYIHTMVFTQVLDHHYMDFVRSRYSFDHVPYLYLSDGLPALNAHWCGYPYPRWGAPSFGGAVEI